MTFLSFIAYWFAFDAFLLGIWCLAVIAAECRNARYDRERQDAERQALLEGFVAHGGWANSK